jgi:archaellum component FlaF (FlaF/FlaG flagellin family)
MVTKQSISTVVQVVLVVIAVSSMVAPVSAQEAPDPRDPAPTTTPTPETHEQVDNSTTLVSAEYDSSDGTATVVIESEIAQQITISDSGAFVEGGVVEQRSVYVGPGERTKITMPVTKSDGFVGISIATQKTLYAVPLKSEVSFFESESTWQTVQVAALGGAFGVLVMAVILAWRLRSGGKSKVDRLA